MSAVRNWQPYKSQNVETSFVVVTQYVFPGSGKAGYLIEPRSQVKKVIEVSGISFTLHDLRRSYITIAESMDISAYALKGLVNHKMSSDVTTGYIVNDVERLREPMQRSPITYLEASARSNVGPC